MASDTCDFSRSSNLKTQILYFQTIAQKNLKRSIDAYFKRLHTLAPRKISESPLPLPNAYLLAKYLILRANYKQNK